ncbi:Isopenicillin N epimerase component 1 [Fonsecaea pedrosoi]|nr:Isopenicillin N epimerase component 1 [Fonsecaea pedrosoi]
MVAATTAAVGLAGAAALSAYLNAKFHLGKDLTQIYYHRRGERYQARLKAQNKINLWASFCENADKFADRDCIWYSDPSTSPPTVHNYTWREAREHACRYAQWFLEAGVRPGDCVGFYLHNSPDFVLGWLGLLAIGCYPAMINYNLVGGALVHCVKIAECRILLVDEDFRDRVSSSSLLEDKELQQLQVSVHVIDGDFRARLARFPGEMPSAAAEYTKDIGEKTRLALRYTSKKFSASRFWDEVRTSRSTIATYVGEIARYLLAQPPSPLDREHNLRMVYGNGMRPDVWGRFQSRFGIPRVCEFYGSTEGGLSHLNVQEGEFLRDAVGHDGLLRRWQLRGEMVPVLVDAESHEIVRDAATGFAVRMPYEVGGELLFRLASEAAFVGYWRNREATEKKLARDVFRKGDLWYRTGDSLKRDSDGRWSFLDRLGDTFRWKGENVSTAEVSECLGRYPGVIDANVYGVQVPNHDGRAGCAALMLDGEVGQGFDLDGLLSHAQRDLPGFAIPLFLRIVPTGSLNSMGLKQEKVQPRAEGVDPSRVRGDQVYVLRGGRYVRFTQKDWDDLVGARSRL